MNRTKEQRMADFQHKTFLLMFRILVIFGVPAIIGYFLGKYIDTSFEIRPYGSLVVMICTFIFSWVLVIRMYLRLERERIEIESIEDINTPDNHPSQV